MRLSADSGVCYSRRAESRSRENASHRSAVTCPSVSRSGLQVVSAVQCLHAGVYWLPNTILPADAYNSSPVLQAFLSDWQGPTPGNSLIQFKLPVPVKQESVHQVVLALYSSKLLLEVRKVGEFMAVTDYLQV